METLRANFRTLTAEQLKSFWEADKRKAGATYTHDLSFRDLRAGGSRAEGDAQQVMFLIGAIAGHGFAEAKRKASAFPAVRFKACRSA